MYEENYEKLKTNLQFDGSMKFSFSKNSPMLPFTTRKPERVNFNNGFLSIIGELCRLSLNKKLDFSKENICDEVIDSNNLIVDEENEHVLNLLVNEYLDNNNLKNSSYAQLFQFYSLSDNKNEAKGEKKIAQFLNSIFFKDLDLNSFIEDQSANSNIFLDYICSNLENMDEVQTKKDFCMPSSLEVVINIFKEDFNFLSKNHKSFLIENFDLFLAYYFFLYLNQFIIKASNSSVNRELEETYYLLDWESGSKNRDAYKKGYSSIKKRLDNLIFNLNVVEQTNTILGTHNLLPSELIEYVNNLDMEHKNSFIKYLRIWIGELRELKRFEHINLDDNLENLIKCLRKTIEMDYSEKKASISRFSINVSTIGNKYFLKRRGRMGYTLNMNQDLLMLITAISIGDKEKILISDLFKEYEKRGIFFDSKSKEEILEKLNNLNLINKKSDSGDMQYVKSVL